MNRTLTFAVCLAAAFVAACGGGTHAQSKPRTTSATTLDPSWGALRALVGTWDGTGEDGQSKGTMEVTGDLGGSVLVRRGTNDSPRGHHEDLMVISRGSSGAFLADYFDNEGHAIHYAVTLGEGDKQIVFVSEQAANSPRFRLTYELTAPNEMRVVFDMAAPGSSDFKRYTSGSAHRR